MNDKIIESYGKTIEQYSVWNVTLDETFDKNTFTNGKSIGHEQKGIRPVLVISPESYNILSQTAIVLCCSTSNKKSNN